MKDRITELLRRIEADEDLRILIAVESGSRAWGFASTDSDWDVRFIYVRRPSWYLSIVPGRDVYEMPIVADLDASGWDLPKALRLFSKSNPPLLEWLRSPYIYHEAYSTARSMRELGTQFLSPRSCMHHYLSITGNNYREHLCRESVRLKKYFYALRPVLACRWLERYGTMPPIEFAPLVAEFLPPELHPHIDELLARKMAGEELDSGPRIPELNAFIEAELERLGIVVRDLPHSPEQGNDALDALFRATLDEVWRNVPRERPECR